MEGSEEKKYLTNNDENIKLEGALFRQVIWLNRIMFHRKVYR